MGERRDTSYKIIIKKVKMKAVLKFSLPEDQEDFDLAVHGGKWMSACWDLDQHLRSRLKYEQGLSEDACKALEETRDKLREILTDYNLELK